MERARIRLSEHIGRDPNERIDTAELCWIDPSGIDANSCGVTPLSEFYAADFPDWREDDKWFSPDEGLTAVRKLLRHYERIVEIRNDPLGRAMDVIADNAALLREVAEVLIAAKDAGASFCISVSDR